MGNFSMFYEQALEACEGLGRMVSETGAPEHYLCHGELNQHHILMGPGYTAVIEFNKMHLGVQVADLYHFIRKAMEKHGWNMKLGMRLLNSYDRVLTMGRRSRNIYIIVPVP